MDGTTLEMYEETVDFLQAKVPGNLQKPRVAIICGSGLGGLANTVHEDGKVELDYTSIPHFSPSAGKKPAVLGEALWGLIEITSL